MTFLMRKELDALSLEVYGTTSKWRKLLDTGKYVNELTERLKSTHKTKKVGKIAQYTYETLRTFLLEQKALKATAIADATKNELALLNETDEKTSGN